MEDEYINVTIRYKNQDLDLRFSKRLSLEQLEDLVKKSSLENHLGILEKNWILEISNKPIIIERHRALADYPVGNGDVLEVKFNE
ncbi:EsaB/YukD family protein [Streptococcus pantholopis]|uniref:Ubiquitin-like domain-containing protein n=1 Tax=Streptococcus pantholopis TaxID=1811193 RepID=A0A172Q524_9STRE|nr:hypothetical protein [Streptococcus pantholopis]AND78522.1 hypothetical protein A0O21_00050 [Streptococcus pantholopis]